MKIFCTGITGTIGTAFVKLLNGHEVSGIDRNEESVAKFRQAYPNIDVKVGDFGEVDFSRDKPDLLIHLAAMKHIDLCEINANECVLNNIIKTYNLFKNAYKNKVDILFMSTDKAVEPCSAYGYTKALGEHMAREYGGSIVRSGNVLASSGSVLNIWDEAIKNSQPIKITHKKMRRFFISPENLVKRIWEKYLAGEKLIIPEMDMDIGLIELLEKKLSEHGFTLENYPAGVEYTGLRLGEKLNERLKWSRE